MKNALLPKINILLAKLQQDVDFWQVGIFHHAFSNISANPVFSEILCL